MSTKLHLTDSEKQEIESAIEQLESNTSGELVVYIAQRSDNYSDAAWYLSALTCFFFALCGVALSYMWMLPKSIGVMEICLMIIAGGLSGLLIPVLIPRIRVFLMNDNNVEQRVLTRAHDVFLQKELFKTSGRIGILFYISGLEHKITVLADSGIVSKIEQQELQNVVSEISIGIKTRQFKSGIIKAIKDCENLLIDHGFNQKSDASNELSNNVISEFDNK